MGLFCYTAHYHTSQGSWLSKTIDSIHVSAVLYNTMKASHQEEGFLINTS